MPLPTPAQLTRMRTQANAHGATTVAWYNKIEVNTAKGPTVTYALVSSTTGMRYRRKVQQQAQAGGAWVSVIEEHVTLPASLATSIAEDQVLLIDSAYYDILDIAQVDEALLILLDLTIKRARV